MCAVRAAGMDAVLRERRISRHPVLYRYAASLALRAAPAAQCSSKEVTPRRSGSSDYDERKKEIETGRTPSPPNPPLEGEGYARAGENQCFDSPLPRNCASTASAS